MQKLIKTFFSPSSIRLNLVVTCGIILLLAVSLGMLFYFSHEALHREARLDAEETLEGTVKHVDNILLSVEQSAGNIYSELTAHLNQPERIGIYSRKLVECNPYITGCAICFKPNHYPGRQLYMNYIHFKGGVRKAGVMSNLVTSDKYGSKPYTDYQWYSLPMTTGRACWTDPMPEEEDEGVTLNFCLPIFNGKREPIGVLVAELSVKQLSQLVLSAKSTPNMYSVLLGSNGSFIVHPDQQKLQDITVVAQTGNDDNSTMQKAAEAMLAGETGYMPFRQDGHDWYVFYKPFLQTEVPGRTMEKLSWSIGVVYSEDAVFGNYNYMLASVLVISVLGLLLLYVLCRFVARYQMRPLRQLIHMTQRIAEGHYDDPMPDIKRNDEIGQLYEHFQIMKQSLAAHVEELDQLTDRLKNRREVMHEVYAKEQSVDRVMNSFLHYVSNQMIPLAKDVRRYIDTLCSKYRSFAPEEIGYVVSTINKNSDTIIGLINNMLDTADTRNLADNETRKEAGHE